jgi:NAD(P)-dependent dehydrogenase (short-subunit alcohol dehydrogenase family)
MRLSGKVALVTGSGRGIGRVIAQHLAEEGASVVLNYPNDAENADGTLECIKRAGGRAIGLRADVSSVDQVRAMIDEAVRRLGRIDILVNNAAIDPGAHFLDVAEELFQKVFDTNVKGAYFCAQAAARYMKASKTPGRIINISSVHSRASMPGFSVYAASKGAIEALTRQLALDLSAFGITINAVAPGPIEVEKFVSDPRYDPAAIGREVPLGRVGYPRDISAAVVFLASEEAAWVTGQVITIDGGTLSRLYLYVGRPIPGGPADATAGQ